MLIKINYQANSWNPIRYLYKETDKKCWKY